MQDAFATALERWPRDGVPRSPGAWIVATARNGAIDRIRREQTFARKAELLARLEELPAEEDADMSSIPDERLALALHVLPPGPRGRVAGRAHAARGRRPRDPRDRPRVPRAGAGRSRSGSSARSAASARRGSRSAFHPTTCCPSGCPTCCASLYLVFNEGYAATAGDALVRRELCAEAIRLAKLLCVLMPDEPEAFGLLALLLLQDSRRDARLGRDGELVLLADQDRALWDRAAIDEGLRVLRRAEAIAVRARISSRR